MKEIYYKPFGPTIGKFSLSSKMISTVNTFAKKIIEDKQKSKALDNSHRLAGNVQQQFRLTRDFLLKSGLEKQLNRTIESYYKNVIQVKTSSIKIDRAWIVRQFAGDFNPPHIHKGNVSGVCYLEVPNSIKYNKEIAFAGRLSFFDGRVSMPRNSPPLVKHRITFKPRVGDMYIFPAFLMHDVHPFRNDGERRCFSFNAFVKA